MRNTYTVYTQVIQYLKYGTSISEPYMSKAFCSKSKMFLIYSRDVGSIPGLGRPPGVENGNPFQYSWLKKSPWREEHGGLQFMELQRFEHDRVTKHI